MSSTLRYSKLAVSAAYAYPSETTHRGFRDDDAFTGLFPAAREDIDAEVGERGSSASCSSCDICPTIPRRRSREVNRGEEGEEG